jgi:hypothetical protein
MTLEKSHFQATKRPKRGFVDLDTCGSMVSRPLKNLIFKPPKCRTEALVILWVEGLMPLEESFSEWNK